MYFNDIFLRYNDVFNYNSVLINTLELIQKLGREPTENFK